jgi:hypothetical protein
MTVNNKIIAEGVEKNIAQTKDFLEKLKNANEILPALPVTLSFTQLNKDHPEPVKRAKYDEFGPLSEIKQAAVVYIVSTTDNKDAVSKKFHDLKGNLEKEHEKSYLCRFIKDNYETAPQSGELCLYVGSSRKIIDRVKEHWGIVNFSTYAMHLKDWLLKDNPNDVVITIWAVPDEQYLQIIEDGLWRYYKPIFGRLGGK